MKAILSIILTLTSFSGTYAQTSDLPTAEQMTLLQPGHSRRLQLYDRFFRTTARLAFQNHQVYSNPETLADVQSRLEKVRQSGNPEDIFSATERAQLQKNLVELRQLESGFFEKWYLKIPMTLAIKFQTWLTRKNSPTPQGPAQEELIKHWQEAAKKNSLYQMWSEELPASLRHQAEVQTWGELLEKFNESENFRKYWVETFPDSLPEIKKLMQIWAWEDSSVRSAQVQNLNQSNEYWVLRRQPRDNVPNRFEAILNADFKSLLTIEYSPSLFFNRLSKIEKAGSAIVYHLESVEKGRTMESTTVANENGTDKRTFKGAELLRKTKADEFLQRDYIKRGTLNLFLGLRTMQLNQIQDLMKAHPELTLAVGQMGFSVTGGMAQTVSNRTDTPEDQLLKLTATLIDYIEFANTKDVPAWFKRNTRHVLRTVVGGVGSGGSKALTEPTSRNLTVPAGNNSSAILSCEGVFQ